MLQHMRIAGWLLSTCIGLAVWSSCSGSAVVDPSSSGSGGGSSQASGNQATNGTSATSGGMYSACDAPGSCILASKGCCGVCGTPQLSDFVAINADDAAAFQQDGCSR